MFEQLMRAAERAATGVSRREFFGKLGRGAAAVAAAAAGVAATAASAQAGGGMCTNTSGPCSGKSEGAGCVIPRTAAGVCRSAPLCLCVRR